MGLIRFTLATMVVLQHIGGFPNIGHIAVFFFFVISGYLMTFVMQETYGYSPRGILRFWANRALRLYPAYFVTLAATITCIVVLGPPAAFRQAMQLPQTVIQWLENLSMIYPALLPIGVEPKLSPSTWALTIELFYYAAISLGASRSRLMTWTWLLASIAYHFVTIDRSYIWHYYAVPAGSLPFASGALIYHYRALLTARLAGIADHLLGAGIVLGATLAGLRMMVADTPLASALITATTLPAMLVVISLMVRPWSPVSPNADRILGDLSYPLYIAHWGVAAFMARVLGLNAPELTLQRTELLLTTFLMAVGFAAFCNFCVDRPVETLRRAVRGRSASHGPQAQAGSSSAI